MNAVLPMRALRLLVACAVAACTAAMAADGWPEAARPGAVVLLRHATAPGTGDPPGFRADDCATQRNLSEEGRAEARRLGVLFREKRIAVDEVLTSQWCRTRETARLAFGEKLPRDEPAFNSFLGQAPARREAQTAAARDLLARWRGPGALVVVTHQFNITALTGIGAASAQGVVVRAGPDGGLQVLGTIEP
ncbi:MULTISPECIES: histidine phosphatase family protein [Ramlibacter]|uniref:Histidine phosphatase family protein n=1 Tax=Ramlibacter pinisoli TaxID=2682844 RepID=A0A6N8IXN8_9BURK|nr:MULTISPECIES: histidine phosphatase family protein [Ramlibacter]MBA2961401.1 histidine phosphatase family protein [Ramlibacter sp. CGMCC 1.13660]MVQ31345.1 histidine phosphatase family protein [Ramlibacter pinisoli]